MRERIVCSRLERFLSLRLRGENSKFLGDTYVRFPSCHIAVRHDTARHPFLPRMKIPTRPSRNERREGGHEACAYACFSGGGVRVYWKRPKVLHGRLEIVENKI